MASFPHIKEDPQDWAAVAAHEEGSSNSSRASHGAKQEDVVKKQHFWAQSEQNPWENSTFGCRASKILGKTALWGAERAKREQNPWKNSTFHELIVSPVTVFRLLRINF